MKDIEIRKCLKGSVLKKYYESTDAKIVNEFSLCQGIARIDIAVVNGSFHGYEIKSASDNLDRLPKQIEYYSKVFDYVTIVAEEKHLKGIKSIVPEWVGIFKCKKSKDGSMELIVESIPDKNPSLDGHFLARLLWRQELISVLKEYNIPFRSKDRNWLLCDAITKSLESEKVATIVRERLKLRLTTESITRD